MKLFVQIVIQTSFYVFSGSSVTTYSQKKIVETVDNQSDKSNENSISKSSEHPNINGKFCYLDCINLIRSQATLSSYWLQKCLCQKKVFTWRHKLIEW